MKRKFQIYIYRIWFQAWTIPAKWKNTEPFIHKLHKPTDISNLQQLNTEHHQTVIKV